MQVEQNSVQYLKNLAHCDQLITALFFRINNNK